MSSPGKSQAEATSSDAPAAPAAQAGVMDAKRKAAPQEEEPQTKKKAIRYHTPDYMYGVPVSHKVVKDICAGCLGKKNEELKTNPIVLCDGGCGREYHLQCCLPPLAIEDIPEGSYLCIDCDPDGASSQLEKYFESSWEARSAYPNSREYVASLFDKNEPTPVSEFPRITQLHRDAIGSVRNLQAASVPDDPLGPDFLVGKPLRLYCPVGNSYHNGRIIDWRRATHLRPVSPSSPLDANDFQYGKLSEIARSEFLVSFPAGLDFRKRTVHQWIILEEHSLAVGTSLIFAFDTRKKDWLPGLTWLRTSLELMPILERLSVSEGQVIFETEKIGSTTSWALTQVFGKENHLLLILRDEAVDLFSPSFAERFSRGRASDHGHDLSCILAFTEVEEQRRIRHWYKLPLQNPVNEKAISIADALTLPSLAVSSRDDDVLTQTCPRPCPLIRQGLDRMWIAQQLQPHGLDQTKDAIANIKVKRVKSRGAAFKKLQEQAKSGKQAAS